MNAKNGDMQNAQLLDTKTIKMYKINRIIWKIIDTTYLWCYCLSINNVTAYAMEELDVNIYDIAIEAGVSTATVSRVLNGNKGVGEKTRKKVMEIVEKKKYVPSTLARNLSSGESQNIAFLVPDIENPFFSKILHGISDRATKYGYNVFMFGTDEDSTKEHKVLDGLKKEMIKGLIMIPVCETDKETADKLKAVEKSGISVVLVDRDIKERSFDGVFSEDEEGAFEAVECLVNAGHKKIGVISGPDTSKPGHERLKGYKRALRENNIEINEQYIVDGRFKEQESYEGMKRLMQLPDPPTAIFSSNNMATLGCLKYLKENNMKVVDDIAMVGFDEIKELEYTDLGLTVVWRPVYEMGCEAMELLESNFGRSVENNGDKMIRCQNSIKTKLILRGSEYKRDLEVEK